MIGEIIGLGKNIIDGVFMLLLKHVRVLGIAHVK
jgi:hypothetical protein